MSAPRRAILFLCVANSARSQMAEGLARTLAPPDVPVHSAGSEPGVLNPFAVRVLQELGIDISSQFSKPIDAVPAEEIATVVTLCAEEVCPAFPHEVRRLHWPLEDPATAIGSEEERLERFRRVRDQISRRIGEYLAGQ